MPQFLSATTTSKSSSSATKMEQRDTTARTPDEEERPYHIRSKSIHHQHVDDESSGDFQSDVEEEEQRGHRNGYHLKISHLETVSRTPKENFSDQVGARVSFANDCLHQYLLIEE